LEESLTQLKGFKAKLQTTAQQRPVIGDTVLASVLTVSWRKLRERAICCEYSDDPVRRIWLHFRSNVRAKPRGDDLPKLAGQSDGQCAFGGYAPE